MWIRRELVNLEESAVSIPALMGALWKLIYSSYKVCVDPSLIHKEFNDNCSLWVYLCFYHKYNFIFSKTTLKRVLNLKQGTSEIPQAWWIIKRKHVTMSARDGSHVMLCCCLCIYVSCTDVYFQYIGLGHLMSVLLYMAFQPIHSKICA